MTNAVERMMKEYGVIKTLRCKECGARDFALGQCAEVKCECKYPPFTAGKQIELIKLLAKKHLEIINNETYKYYKISVYGYENITNNFEELLALAALNNKDQLDTAKVKEILER